VGESSPLTAGALATYGKLRMNQGPAHHKVSATARVRARARVRVGVRARGRGSYPYPYAYPYPCTYP